MSNTPTNMIRITGYTDPLMWYSGSIGKEYPHMGQCASGYRTIDNHGFNNIVKSCDAVVVVSECENCEDEDTTIPEIPEPDFSVHTEYKFQGMVTDLMKSGEEILASLTPQKVALWHAATGIAGEAGEILDLIKKHVCNNKPLDHEEFRKELGDLEFYSEANRQILQWTREYVLEGNLEKLGKRYPGGVYSDEAAHRQADKDTDEAADAIDNPPTGYWGLEDKAKEERMGDIQYDHLELLFEASPNKYTLQYKKTRNHITAIRMTTKEYCEAIGEACYAKEEGWLLRKKSSFRFISQTRAETYFKGAESPKLQE